MSQRAVLVTDESGDEVKVSSTNPLPIDLVTLAGTALGPTNAVPVDVLGAAITADLTTVEANTSRLTSGTTPLAPGVATATTALNIGGQYDSTQKTLSNGQQASYAMSARGAMIVTAGAEVLNVIQKGMGYSAKVDVTRPANTDTYDAYDNVGGAAAAMEFTNVGSAGEFLVTAVSLRFDLAAVPAGMTSFILHLYNATPPSAPVDAATWALSAPDALIYLGNIAISTPVDCGAVLYIEMTGLAKQVKLVSSSLWGVLVTVGTWAATSEGTHTVTVHTRAV